MELTEVNILVVDDVNTMRLQVKHLLEVAGFKNIALAEDGEIARDYLLKKHCHLVLCDWHMINLSGLDLLKWLRQSPKHQFIGFILLTAEQTKNSVIEAIGSKVDDYLIKPLSADQIENKVKLVLRKKKIIL